jgi:hypothetical protein
MDAITAEATTRAEMHSKQKTLKNNSRWSSKHSYF